MLVRDAFKPHDAAPPLSLVAHPRISLGSGRIAAYALRMSREIMPEVAWDAACGLALATGTMVSVGAPGAMPALPAMAVAALKRSGLKAHQIEIMVTAGQIDEFGPESMLALSALQDLGIGVVLAGFGQSGPALPPGLPLSRVVLAPEVLRDVPAIRAANAQLHAIVNMARRQGLLVTATGVETETQRAVLSGFGCDHGEGPLFGPPRPIELSPGRQA